MHAKISADKKARVLTSAEAVFLRQGYPRTTMGDLADAAGISRPALYLLYPRKHEVFSCIIDEEAQFRPPLLEVRSETALLEHWMVWVCDLWLGDRRRELHAPRSEDRRAYQRSDSLPRDVAFLQAILEEGLRKRVSARLDTEMRTSVARLLTFCACGLLDGDLDAETRHGLLVFQANAMAQAIQDTRLATPSAQKVTQTINLPCDRKRRRLPLTKLSNPTNL